MKRIERLIKWEKTWNDSYMMMWENDENQIIYRNEWSYSDLGQGKTGLRVQMRLDLDSRLKELLSNIFRVCLLTVIKHTFLYNIFTEYLMK